MTNIIRLLAILWIYSNDYQYYHNVVFVNICFKYPIRSDWIYRGYIVMPGEYHHHHHHLFAFVLTTYEDESITENP